MKAILMLEKEDLAGVLAILDADFWHLDGVPHSSSNLLLTDFHDLEMMIINSKALDIVLCEYGSATKINKFVRKQGGSDIRSVLLDICLPIGLLRWLSVKGNLNLTFEGLNFVKFIRRESLELDLSTLVRNVLSLTSKKGLRVSAVLAKL